MGRIDSIGCHVEGDTVYVYDQDGNNIDSIMIPPLTAVENVYVSGRSVMIETPSDIHIYSLRGRPMVPTGNHNNLVGSDILPVIASLEEADDSQMTELAQAGLSAAKRIGAKDVVNVLGGK